MFTELHLSQLRKCNFWLSIKINWVLQELVDIVVVVVGVLISKLNGVFWCTAVTMLISNEFDGVGCFVTSSVFNGLDILCHTFI